MEASADVGDVEVRHAPAGDPRNALGGSIREIVPPGARVIALRALKSTGADRGLVRRLRAAQRVAGSLLRRIQLSRSLGKLTVEIAELETVLAVAEPLGNTGRTASRVDLAGTASRFDVRPTAD